MSILLNQRWQDTATVQKVIFHLEAFVAKFMRILERYALSNIAFYLAQTTNVQQLFDGSRLLDDKCCTTGIELGEYVYHIY